MKNRSLMVLNCLMSMLAVSCSDESTSSQTLEEDKCGAQICDTDEVCLDNKCQKKEDDKCGAQICDTDEVCLDNKCQKKVALCGDRVCGADEACLDGECIERSSLCGGIECGEDEVCRDDECVQQDPNQCGTETCSSDEVCIENTCMPRERCGEQKKICGSDEYCDEEKGECVPYTYECNPACLEGESCEDGVCVIPDLEQDPDVDPDPMAIPAAITITPDSGLKTTRSGDSAEFCVGINQEPENELTIAVASQNEELGTVAPSSLMFNAENWDFCQTVTVQGTTHKTGDEQKYQIQVGPATGDERFESLEPQMVSVTHVDDVQDEACASDQTKDDAGKCISVPVEAIQMNTDAIKLLRGQTKTIKVTVEPQNATNKDFEIDIQMDDASQNLWTDKTAKSFMSAKKVSDGVSITGQGIGAPDIILTVMSKSNANIKAQKTIHIKPYVEMKGPEHTRTVTNRNFSYTRKFITNDDCLDEKKAPASRPGDLTCRYYKAYTAHVFNHDLYYDYVRPKMMLVNGKRYATRASVVAAARFLTLQFPFDIPYRMGDLQNGYSHYSWSTNGDLDKGCEGRIFGLNLQNKVFNNYQDDTTDEKGNPQYTGCKNSKGKYITTLKTNYLPWGCAIHKNDKSLICNKITNENDVFYKREYSGMECSGLVTWALRNGRFNLGDWKALFYKTRHYFEVNKKYTEKCDAWLKKEHSSIYNTVRNFGLEAFVNSNKLPCGLPASNKNNSHDWVYKKMLEMKESDIINLADLDSNENKEKARKKAKALKDAGMSIKAGDILIREKRILKTEENNPNVKYSSGHVAMIIGLEKDIDGYPTKIYVGEATAAGNTVTTYDCKNNKPSQAACNNTDSLGAFVNVWRMDNDKDKKGNLIYEGGEAFLIKMDHVYNYFSRANNLTDSDGKALDGNTYKYTDCWNGDTCN